jgi:hypothetical protein
VKRRKSPRKPKSKKHEADQFELSFDETATYPAPDTGTIVTGNFNDKAPLEMAA